MSCGLIEHRKAGQQGTPLVYDTEAILPTKTTLQTLRSKLAHLAENNASLTLDKDLVDKARDPAAVHMVTYKQ